MLDFKIKSFVHDYKVKFVSNVPNVLKKEIGEITIGDLIIIARELSNEQH